MVWSGQWSQTACSFDPPLSAVDARSGVILCNSLRPAGVWLSGNQKPDGTVSAQLVLASDLPVPPTNLAATYASGEPMVLTGAWTAGRLVLHGIDRELNPPLSEGDYVREKSFDWDSALAAPGDMQATGTLITRTVNRATGNRVGLYDSESVFEPDPGVIALKYGSRMRRRRLFLAFALNVDVNLRAAGHIHKAAFVGLD
jgi:hypothetical protein